MSREHKSRFEWLQDYLELDDEIRYLEWKIRKSNAEVNRWSEGDLSRLHVSGSDSRAAHVGEEVPELQTKLTECKAEQYDLLKLIDSFSGYENQILKMKYVQGMSLEDIADKLGYSYETIRAKHAELHRRLNWIDELEEQRRQLENRLDY
ncbi:sigma factor-like helix-turn-helix DNA-binding protein [Lacticaseibacillus paracasei]|uniref:sigma factor-like helix-turn-helix DNA-binding protein n=1 Tax=Lacticaseibacillus paracasei TaxID=1597 RepID=UPI001C125C62|nr:sigma factor-like helix-turn-helix DNA-binding protein [Lacticaseibacillus paracasei]MBU5324058.1 LuxR C-terminal-related transcriptional regulator [Lacticaseibacillus paracasei]